VIVVRLTEHEVRTYDGVPHLWLSRRDAACLIEILKAELAKPPAKPRAATKRLKLVAEK